MVGEIWIIPKNVFWKFCEIERFVSARQYGMFNLMTIADNTHA